MSEAPESCCKEMARLRKAGIHPDHEPATVSDVWSEHRSFAMEQERFRWCPWCGHDFKGEDRIFWILLQDGDPEAVTFTAEDADAWKAEEVIGEDGYGERDHCSVKGWKALWMEVDDGDDGT